MTTAEYNYYRAAATLSLIPDEENPIFLFSQTYKELLLAIANGLIDARQLAKVELRNRGLDTKTGTWIGWQEEKSILEVVS